VSNAAQYSAVETLRDGRRIEIRALRPNDRSKFLEAVSRTSSQSLYRRFFNVKRHFTEVEQSFFIDVDFVKHIALIAVLDEGGKQEIGGGGRFVLVNPQQAEVAFMVVDRYQGLGIGTVLMRHIAALARSAGLQELVAQVLPSNAAMLKVFEASGFRPSIKRESGSIHVTLHLGAESATLATPLDQRTD
jgi:RimJ/RimL family protein N-acetyltransferase